MASRKSRKSQRRKIGLLVACLACAALAAVPQDDVQVAEDVNLGEPNEPNQHQERPQIVLDALRNHKVLPEDAPKPAIAVQAPLPHATPQERAKEGA